MTHLPPPRGPLSHAVITALRDGPDGLAHDSAALRGADPWGEDLHLALYVLYELHYRGFDTVPDDLEWHPALLTVRRGLEDAFLSALRAAVPTGRTAAQALDELLVEPVEPTGSVSHHLAKDGEVWQVREYAALRSLYHLKEADPHAWVLPRLYGRAKAAMAAIEYDEFGAGRAERVHAQLFADLMSDLRLDPAYGRYLDQAPAEALVVVNLMSLFGLHRALRGALVGHFATVEITSPPGSRRLAAAMRRLDAGAAAEHFYAEHVEADAVHEQVVRREVVAGLLADEPDLDADVAFGADATVLVEDRFAAYLLDAWGQGRSALRGEHAPALAGHAP
ncbi:iron-containing redox enzyme family protein [Streptomyces longispororuber]|uniref:iron-containing redox enzyme family protein n=1 Tax=Streptomyces longispororuber TaxID=68230 RepID=UPI00340939E2